MAIRRTIRVHTVNESHHDFVDTEFTKLGIYTENHDWVEICSKNSQGYKLRVLGKFRNAYVTWIECIWEN